MTQTRLALLLLAVGCSTEGSGTESATATSYPSGPYVVPPDEPQTPDLNDAAVAAGIEEALDVLFTFDLTPIEVGYAAIMAEAEDGCPTWAIGDGNQYWTASCTTSGGARFDGYGAVIDYAEFEADDGLTYTGHLFNSVSSVTTAAGETFTGGGIAYAIHGTDGAGYEVTSFGTSSDFDWTGPDAADSWLRADAELDFEATQVTGEGFQLFVVDGTIASLSAVQAVVFSDLVAVDHLGRPEGCVREPSGAVAVLTNDGHWFDLAFEGIEPDGELDPTVGCDGCATAWFRGHPLGEVCMDADAAYAWAD